MAYLMLIIGLATLIVGGELLVKGAVSLAYKFRISKLVIGMTIVSFGTSAPELLVSIKAVLGNHPDIAMGNVVGSNIANIGLVMGLTALIFPIVVDRNSIRFDWPMLLFSTLLAYLLILDGEIVRWEGLIMVSALLAFSYFLIWKSRKDNRKTSADKEEGAEEERIRSSVWRNVLFIVLGCVGLSLGADWLVEGAVEVAAGFGVSDLVISVTIVAFGTSAPELVTSLVAAVRRHSDISVGNLIGSNIFNLLAILGITSIIHDIEVSPAVIQFDMLWVTGLTVIIFPMMLNNRTITRLEGGILAAVYVAYILSLLIFSI